jgi:basic membrane protein A
MALLMVIATLLLTACGSKSTPAPSSSGSTSGAAPAKKIKVALLVTQLGDRSFADSAWDGMKRLQKDMGDKVETKVIEAPEIASFEENVVSMAKGGYDLIISLGFTYVDLYNKVAPQYPNTKFLLVDAEAKQPNVRSVVFREHEGSYLVGALAAMSSKTGKIGFIGGQDIPLIHRFQGGYEQGAKDVNPKIEVKVAYVGSWTDAAKGKELTSVMYNQGADIVYAAAGGSGAGTIEAAKQAKKFAIGVDSNQDYLAPENMLASMVKRVDNAVYAAGKDLVDGKFTAGTIVMGLKEDGVGVSGLPPVNSDISIKNATKANLDKVAKLRQDIIDGKIKVVDKMQDTK